MADEIKDAFIADFDGLYGQHCKMWDVYNSSLRLLLVVISLPLLVGAVLLEGKIMSDVTLHQLPLILVAVMIITAVLHFVLIAVVIHHRLDVIFYARALNRYRSIYLTHWNEPPSKVIDVSPMPTNPNVPPFFEPTGPMGLIVLGSGFINSLYFSLGLFNLLAKSGEDGLALAIAIVALVLYLLANHCWYWINARRFAGFSTTDASTGASEVKPRSLAKRVDDENAT